MAMNLLSGMQYVQQQGEAGRQRGLEDRFNRLAGEAFNAPDNATRDAAVGQIAVNNPGAAFGLKEQFQADEDRTLRQLTGAARYLKGAMDTNNPQAMQGAWRTVLPGLIRSGVVKEGELSPTWDPSYADTVHQVLAMGEGRGGAGGVIQSQKISDDGYIINTYRDGRMEKTGQKVDRQAWLRDQPGLPVGIVGKDASFTPLGGSEELPANGWTDVGEGGARVRFNVNEFTPQQQERVARTVSMMQQAGYSDDEIGQFVQSQMPQQVSNIGAPRHPAGGPTRSLNRPSAAEDAAAVEAAKQQAQLQYLPQELGMRTEADIAKARGVEQAKAGVERDTKVATRTRDANDALGLIAEARRLLPGATGGTLAAAGDRTAAFFGKGTAGAQANAALKTISGQLTAKQPRMEGPQSDRDVQMYKDMAGDVANENLPVSIRMAALDQIERLQQKYANGSQRPAGPTAGTVEDGYRFRGGNPADQNNWERL